MVYERKYLRVTPTSEDFSPRNIPETISTFHKLWRSRGHTIRQILNPFYSASPAPITFELFAISEGKNEPVEFYYGVDDPEEGAFETLEKRLRSIYPSSFDIERVETDLIAKLIPPVEYSASEFADRLEQGDLYYDPDDGHARADGGVETSDDAQSVSYPGGSVTLDPPSAVSDDRPLSHLSRPTLAPASDSPTPKHESGQTDNQDSRAEDESVGETGETGEAGGAGGAEQLEEGETEQRVYARPPLKETTPVGVRWNARALTEKDDYMTMLKPFSEQAPASVSSKNLDRGKDDPVKAEPPLATLIDHLTEATQPLAFQVLFRPKVEWPHKAKERRTEIQARTTTTYETDPYNSTGESSIEYDVGPDEGSNDHMRLDLIDQKNNKQSYFANVRAFSTLIDESIPPELDRKLDEICAAFDIFDGEFYRIEGERFGQGIRGKWSAKWSFKRFRERTMKVGSGLIPGTGICPGSGSRKNWLPSNKLRPGGRHLKPDFVLDGDELANLLVIPPSNQLSVEAARGARAEQESRNPQPRPHQDIMGKLRTGLAAGHAKDNDGNIEDAPTCIPPELLYYHYLRTGTTGAGKSVAFNNDALSLYETTDGPIFVVDHKGGDMMENYMRAHAARFGFEDLEENVLHFKIPDILPGLSFFDIRPALADERDRTDACQFQADYYEEMIELVMGKERYERATAGPTLLKHIVKALYDAEYGLQNGNKDGTFRESINYFGHDALERALDQIRQADVKDDFSLAPQSSNEQTQRVINRRLMSDSQTFGHVLDGVENRVGTVSQDDRLREIFNNTDPQFSFRDLLDERKVVLLDFGGMREKSAKVMTAVVLTRLYDALRSRDMSSKPDGYVANLLIDEAASVVVSDTMNTLLSKGREFKLSVGLIAQFPEQFREEGNKEVYLNALNNVGTKLVGQVNVDQKLAQALSHEDLPPEEVKNVISAMPRGEVLMQIPSPEFGETGPTPFTAAPLDIPAGHPAGDEPFTDEDEDRFQRALKRVHEHTQNEYGIVGDEGPPEEQTPEEIQELVGLETSNLDVLLAHIVGNLQIRMDMPAEPGSPEGVNADEAGGEGDETLETGRDANVWIPAEDVDAEIEAYFEHVEGDISPPDPDKLGEIREKSQLFETDLGDEHQPIVRLTTLGEEEIAIETGSVRASGGEDHDTALERVHATLTNRGFHVHVFEQDRSDMGDAKAFHPEVEDTFAIEAETTTPENPRKVLKNLQRAQEDGRVPMFVVEAGTGDKDKEYWANRVEGILQPPVKDKHEESGDVAFYTTDDPIRYNGGRAVRQVTDGNRGTIWTHSDGEMMMQGSAGVPHAELPSLDAVGAMREFPGIVHYDEDTGGYTVLKNNDDKGRYPSREAFEDRWVIVKRPFVPETDLPNTDFDHDDYHIVILPENDTKAPVVYQNGTTHSLDILTDESAESTVVSSTSSAQSEDEENEENEPSEQESAVNEIEESDVNKSPADAGNDDSSQESGTENESSVSNGDAEKETPAEELRDPDKGVDAFAATYLVEAEDTVTPVGEIYEQYKVYTDEYEFETRNRSQFTRSLKRATSFEFESERKRIDGNKTTVYIGINTVSK